MATVDGPAVPPMNTGANGLHFSPKPALIIPIPNGWKNFFLPITLHGGKKPWPKLPPPRSP